MFHQPIITRSMALYYHTDTQLRRCIIRCRSIISRSDDGIKIESDRRIPFFVQLMIKNWVCHSWKNRSWIDCHKFGSTLELYKCKEERILFCSHIIYIYRHHIKLLCIWSSTNKSVVRSQILVGCSWLFHMKFGNIFSLLVYKAIIRNCFLLQHVALKFSISFLNKTPYLVVDKGYFIWKTT